MLQKIGVLILAFALAACSSPQNRESKTSNIIKCPEERAQICTREYRPVCATRDTGVRCVTTPCPSSEQKTYGNACSACADQKVIEYRTDPCPQAVTKE
jgi:hypothetical protein